MNRLNMGTLSACISAFSSLEMGAFALAHSNQPDLATETADVIAKSIEAVMQAIRECESAEILDAVATLKRIHIHISNVAARPSAAALEAELRHAKECVISSLSSRALLYIGDDRKGLLEQEQLFGARAYDAYRSARKDITEAGNCLASECNTAAVFHLMRSAEVALRALARDRGVSFKDKPLENKEWGQILGSLESKVGGLREAPRSKWPRAEVRDDQIRFYGEVIQELRGFNDAWRRHVSHADTEAFYNRDDAFGIFKHVRSFMQKLSEKISENDVTAELWP